MRTPAPWEGCSVSSNRPGSFWSALSVVVLHPLSKPHASMPRPTATAGASTDPARLPHINIASAPPTPGTHKAELKGYGDLSKSRSASVSSTLWGVHPHQLARRLQFTPEALTSLRIPSASRSFANPGAHLAPSSSDYLSSTAVPPSRTPSHPNDSCSPPQPHLSLTYEPALPPLSSSTHSIA
ncbi:hypothetical protein NMY22_g10099 [Coprinellus aureogranulatus]|nr:hypothetical protein NMY22_g10099 [Coprinellus aureogranulatus]